MDSFRNTVKNMIPKVYNEIINDNEIFGRTELIYALTYLLGYVPSSWELDSVFKNKNEIALKDFEEVILNKMKYIHFEQYLHNVFLKFDTECKGYVTLYDFQNIFETLELNSNISWCKFKEGFNNITESGAIDFTTFISIFCLPNEDSSTRKNPVLNIFRFDF